jgi:hypothetical protein
MGSPGRLARRSSRSGPIPQAKGATFYVYRLSNNAGEHYYGVRATTKAPAEDRYMGTGVWPVACRKAGLKLTKRVMKSFEDYGAARWYERKLIAKAVSDPMNRNRKLNPNWMRVAGVETLVLTIKSEHVARVRKYVARLTRTTLPTRDARHD